MLPSSPRLDPDEPKDKLRGGYPGATTKPTRTVNAGDRIGSLEVVASPAIRAATSRFSTRATGRCSCGDAYATLGGVVTAAKAHPWFPLVTMATRHKRQHSRPRGRWSRASLRGSRRATASSSMRHSQRCKPRSREEHEVPRQGLDTTRVIDEAARIANTEGFAAVTLARVAAALSGRAPSLYNHVSSVPTCCGCSR